MSRSTLSASAFPEGTPLNVFFAWNEARHLRDRRYIVACDIYRLVRRFGGETAIAIAHLTHEPVILWRHRERMVLSLSRARSGRVFVETSRQSPAVIAARHLVECLLAGIGAAEIAAHAAVFRAFEELAAYTDLGTLARLRPRRREAAAPARPREILIIKLGALGDFIQALGPVPAIRRHHQGDRITLLTTPRHAELAAQTRLFDDILVDRRPRGLDLPGWLRFRHSLRRRHFDRVYDFQTSDRTTLYALLLLPGPLPEWSGIVWRSSHPHANAGRDRLHTMDRQAEQLLMAGIHPVALVPSLPSAGSLPAALASRRFVLLIPGSSPRHHGKRWPVRQYGQLAQRLSGAGYLPVVVGVDGEQELGLTIREACPETVDLVGQTDIAGLATLAQATALTIGNDTGATHVAAAAGNPVVVLFSQASLPSLCAPRGAAVQVLREPDLADLPVERVLATALAAMATPANAGN